MIDIAAALVGAASIPIAIVAMFAIIRAVSAVVHRVRLRGGPAPLIIHASPPSSTEGGDDLDIAARVAIYVAEDLRSTRVIAPGASNVRSPEVPTESIGDTKAGALALLLVTAIGTPPAYNIYITRLASRLQTKVYGVRIAKSPGGAILDAKSFSCRNDETTADDALVREIGTYCLRYVQKQRAVSVRTARWEKWFDRGGYEVFREGLAEQRAAERRDKSHESVRIHRARSLQKYEQASSLAIGNVTLAMRRGELLELSGDFPLAITVYKLTLQLWPEVLELRYRLAGAQMNSAIEGYDTQIDKAFKDLTARLRIRRILWSWILTFRPSRRNLGERRYWWSWLKITSLRRFSWRSKRRDLLFAVKAGSELLRLKQSLPPRALPRSRDEHMALCEKFTSTLATKNNIGWLAHYNAACFYSNALDHPELTEVDRRYLVDRAFGELRKVARDPGNNLNTLWMFEDPDLASLNNTARARDWRSFFSSGANQ